ncbi:MAG: hypothetical protein U9N59_06000 [Campylobacterota bacterium]|nr:hypothetical protein [Campylobacterota bacterium]
MKYLILIITIILSFNLNANDCISFEGVRKKSVVTPIISELKLLGINSKINVSHSCKIKIFLPIDIYIENDSGVRNTQIHLISQIRNNPVEERVIYINDTDTEFYDLAKTGKSIKHIIIKKHSKIIANSIKSELF